MNGSNLGFPPSSSKFGRSEAGRAGGGLTSRKTFLPMSDSGTCTDHDGHDTEVSVHLCSLLSPPRREEAGGDRERGRDATSSGFHTSAAIDAASVSAFQISMSVATPRRPLDVWNSKTVSPSFVQTALLKRGGGKVD